MVGVGLFRADVFPSPGSLYLPIIYPNINIFLVFGESASESVCEIEIGNVPGKESGTAAVRESVSRRREPPGGPDNSGTD